MNRNHYDYIVLGLGGLGSAAVSWLVRRATGYVKLAQKAYAAWAETAAEAQEQLVLQTGGLDFSPLGEPFLYLIMSIT